MIRINRKHTEKSQIQETLQILLLAVAVSLGIFGVSHPAWADEVPGEEPPASSDSTESDNEAQGLESPESWSLSYQVHMEAHGDSSFFSAGQVAGLPGKGYRMESLLIEGSEDLGIRYGVHVENIGWQAERVQGTPAGTKGQALRIEALWIDMDDEVKKTHSLIYRVYVEGTGWLPYSKNGERTGSEGLSSRIEAIDIQLVSNESLHNYHIQNILLQNKTIIGEAHVQNMGWISQNSTNIFGTTGKGLRLEAIRWNEIPSELQLSHDTHISQIGWTGFKDSSNIAGTVGRSLAMEAIKLQLTGPQKEYYDVYYRAHVEKIGWLDWAKNAEVSGTTGYGLKIEALEIRILPKNRKPSKETYLPSKIILEEIQVNYKAHIQNHGWLSPVSNGETAGFTNSSLRLEAMQITQTTNPFVHLEYRSYSEDLGWGQYVHSSAESGSIGLGKKLEAIEMRLSGLLSSHYEVYYRLHQSGSGWLDWASSTHPTGIIGVDTSFDAVEVTLLPRTTPFTGNIGNPFTKNYQAKPGLIYYTTQALGLYTDKSISNKILDIPSSTYLIGVEDGEFLKTEHQGITGYVHKASLSRHTVTLYKNVILVNKKHSLPSSFNPGINADANAALSRMAAAAAKEGIYLQTISAYRSYQYQHDLFNRYVRSHGRTEAERFSMRAGHSEHQTGQAFDLGKRGGGSALSQSFGRTPEGLWLAKNAPYYGFVLRYPEGKEHITGIKYEPWHFRYVGSELAVKITNSGKTMDEFFQAVAPTY